MEKQATQERLSDHAKMPRVGQVVAGRYEILNLVGEGGFAVVYQVRDVKLGGILALKILDPDKSTDTAFAKRFEQEINLVRELQHHNTIKIWDAGHTEWGCLYCAMEMVKGEELAKLVRRSHGLPVDRVVRIVTQILRSLGEAHEAGIVHRDLKPGNIMVCQLPDEPDYVKVLDFGIAKARSERLTKVKTQTGMVMCTPNYASPELLRNEGVCPATDLYALGLIMAEMLTGQQAVDANSLIDIIQIQASPHPVPLDPRLYDMPIGAVIAKALVKQVDGRYQSAGEMLADLRRIESGSVASLPVPPTPAVGISDAIARMKTTRVSGDQATATGSEQPTKSRLVPILVALVVLLSVGMVLLFMALTQERDAQDSEPVASNAQSPTIVSETLPGEQSPPPEHAATETVAATPEQRQETVAPVPDEGIEASSEDNALNVPVELARTDEVAPPPSPSEPSEPDPEPRPVAQEESSLASETGDEPGEVALAATPSEEAEPADSLVLRVTSEPSNVRVYVDGDLVGRTPLDDTIEGHSGTVEIMLRKTGFETVRYQVSVADGSFHRDVHLRRERSQEQDTVSPPSFGTIPLNSGD